MSESKQEAFESATGPKSTRRRLLGRLGLGIVLVVGGVAAGRVAPPLGVAPKAEPQVVPLLRIARTPPRIFPGTAMEQPNSDEFAAYRRTQAVLIRSKRNLKAALKRDGVAKLEFVNEKADPVAWLRSRLRIDFPEDATILRVALDGADSAALVVLVDAVVNSYRDDAIYAERIQRDEVMMRIEKAYAEAVDQLASKTASLRKAIAHSGGTGRTDAEERLLVRQIIDIRREMRRLALERSNAESRGAAKFVALGKQESLLTKELMPLTEAISASPAMNGDVEALRDEIAGEREMVALLGRQLFALRLELQAPSRVVLWQAAEVQ